MKANAPRLTECPHCGQRMLVRHGIQLSPLLADIFDLIERRQGGITIAVLAVTLYGESSRQARRRVAVNINHINDRLEPTNIKISNGRETYRIVKRRL